MISEEAQGLTTGTPEVVPQNQFWNWGKQGEFQSKFYPGNTHRNSRHAGRDKSILSLLLISLELAPLSPPAVNQLAKETDWGWQ